MMSLSGLTIAMHDGPADVTVPVGGPAAITMSHSDDDHSGHDGHIMTGLDDAVAGPVWRMYQAALGREPDSGGFGAWMAAVQSGLGTTQLAHAFMNSGEYQGHFGTMTDHQFLDQLYHTALGRDPDAAGMDAWEHALGLGMGRDAVVAAFAQCPELIGLSAQHASHGEYWLA